MLKLGIENLDKHLEYFQDKKVGLITNHTGLDKNFKSTIDILNEKVNLTALYAPEHGIRGDIEAGKKLETYVDDITGLTVFSLYGENRKPTPEMLENVDILCFDIQDVGARYYTYIYTMAYSMIAAKENNKQFVVFDRPNPLGGSKIEGSLLDLQYRSFIGYYPILQRHGLTVGELALLFNKEFDINCDLKVVEMDDWKRNQEFDELGLKWVLPSPNLPTIESNYAYLATCIFEGTNISEGRGTTKPFSVFGSPWLKNRLMIEELNKMNIPGISFRETYFTPTFSKHANEVCKGIEIYITDKDSFEPVIFSMKLVKLIENNHSEFAYNKPYHEGREPMINLHVGDNYIRENTLTIDEIKQRFIKDEKEFEDLRGEYLIYV